MSKVYIISILLLFHFSISSQKGIVNFGIQYRPILPFEFFNVNTVDNSNTVFSTSISQKYGYSYGMNIRWNFQKTLALETGINYIRRNYLMKNTLTSNNQVTISDFGQVNYEIPIQGLFYVQMSKQMFLNMASGISFNSIATDVVSISDNKDFSQKTRKADFHFAYLLNIGAEYRTKSSGFFYFGASMHSPFRNISSTNVKYTPYQGVPSEMNLLLDGNFITFDFRYYFQISKD